MHPQVEMMKIKQGYLSILRYAIFNRKTMMSSSNKDLKSPNYQSDGEIMEQAINPIKLELN